MGVIYPNKKSYRFNVNERSNLERGDEPPNISRLRQKIEAQAQRCGYKHFGPADGLSAMLRFSVQVDDAEREVKVTLSQNGGWRLHENLTACIRDYLERLKVSDVKEMVGGSNFTMDTKISIDLQVKGTDLQSWVLTRLHARYNAKTLKDDLVFAKADPIIGGRGVPIWERGELREEGAQPSVINNFQARYAILYPWKGKATCKMPVRWRWDKPLHGGARTAKPALDLASTSRKKIKLSSVIKSRDVPGLSW